MIQTEMSCLEIALGGRRLCPSGAPAGASTVCRRGHLTDRDAVPEQSCRRTAVFSRSGQAGLSYCVPAPVRRSRRDDRTGCPAAPYRSGMQSLSRPVSSRGVRQMSGKVSRPVSSGRYALRPSAWLMWRTVEFSCQSLLKSPMRITGSLPSLQGCNQFRRLLLAGCLAGVVQVDGYHVDVNIGIARPADGRDNKSLGYR